MKLVTTIKAFVLQILILEYRYNKEITKGTVLTVSFFSPFKPA